MGSQGPERGKGAQGAEVVARREPKSREEERAKSRERRARFTHGAGLLLLVLIGMIAFGGILGAMASGQGADVGGIVGVFMAGMMFFGFIAVIVWAGRKAARHVRILHLHVLDARRRKGGKGRRGFHFGHHREDRREE